MDNFSLQGLNLSQTPSGFPPPGVIPNLIDPETLERVTVECGVVFMSVGVIFCAINLLHHVDKFRRPEYCIMLALPFIIAYTVMVMVYSHNARHQWDTPLSIVLGRNAHDLQLAELMIVVPASLLPKTAIIFLYLEIFKANRKFTIAAYVAFALALADYIPWLILAPVFCRPSGHDWGIHKMLQCAKVEVWAVVASSLNLTLDLFLFIMPIPPIVKLQLPIRRKIAIIAVFATALLGIAASCISIVYRAILLNTNDATWYTHMCEIATYIEAWVAVIVCCAPGCAGYFIHLKRKSSAAYSRTSSDTSKAIGSTGQSQRKQSNIHDSLEEAEPPLHNTHGDSILPEQHYTRMDVDFERGHDSQEKSHQVYQV